MTTVDDHIREVLARGTGWVMRGQWPVLDAVGGAHVLVHGDVFDTWGRTFIPAGEPLDAMPEMMSRRTWITGYFTAADAADEAEEVARLTALTAAELR